MKTHTDSSHGRNLSADDVDNIVYSLLDLVPLPWGMWKLLYMLEIFKAQKKIHDVIPIRLSVLFHDAFAIS